EGGGPAARRQPDGALEKSAAITGRCSPLQLDGCGDDRALHRQLSWSSNGWRAVAILAEIGQASLVGRIPEGEIMLCGAVTASLAKCGDRRRLTAPPRAMLTNSAGSPSSCAPPSGIIRTHAKAILARGGERKVS